MYKTLIVVDRDDVKLDERFSDVISFETYLRDYPKLDEPKTRIINLCDTEHYLSKGYYCSLLAEARSHAVLPSVKTINGLRNLGHSTENFIPYPAELERQQVKQCELVITFGHVADSVFTSLASKLFAQFRAPLLKVILVPGNHGFSYQVERISLSQLDADDRNRFMDRLAEFTQTVWRNGPRKKRYRWDMAILVDPDEKVPPSNREAISRFIKAAAKNGIHAERLSADQIAHIGYYDALFIRETTAIDHHTYRLASKADDLGLVVIDDPVSILRCCNKVYLHDAFSYQKVPALKTEVVTSAENEALDHLENSFGYPLVLKMPESSFSKGVFKVENREQLAERLSDLFQQSSLVLAQEYLYTEFDWRIGVLNGRAVYACRYFMARNHWQIYNHASKRHFSGDFDPVPTFEVPKAVLDAALKAAKTIGNGLYGVDIKQHDNHAYVIEVNDNPSIDHKVEDAYLGDELYMQVMAEFARRLELRGR